VGKAATRLPPDADRLVSLLAAGLNDKSIAHQLGMASRTLDRRIDELMTGSRPRPGSRPAGWRRTGRTGGWDGDRRTRAGGPASGTGD